MSESHPHAPVAQAAFTAPVLMQATGILMLIAGLGLWGLSYAIDATMAWSGWVIGAWYSVGFGLFAAVFLSMNSLASGGWAATIKRVPEAMTRYLLVAVIPFAILIAGMYGSNLYEWASHDHGHGAHAELLEKKRWWLDPTWWIIRMGIYFALWNAFAWLMVSHSRKQDVDGDLKHSWSIRKISAPFCMVFAISLTFASIDYIKSIDFAWFSTMFGVYQFAGVMQSGFAILILLLVALRNSGHMRENVNENHLHTLGIWLLSTSVFWGYIWFCQFMLIWYSNIPEETAHYFARWQDPSWFWISFVLNPLLNFAIPFLVLLPRPNKRNPKVLAVIALVALSGRFIDLWQFVVPRPESHVTPGIPAITNTPWEAIIAVGPTIAFIGLFVFTVMKALERAPLYATKDPFFQEGLHHHL